MINSPYWHNVNFKTFLNVVVKFTKLRKRSAVAVLVGSMHAMTMATYLSAGCETHLLHAAIFFHSF